MKQRKIRNRKNGVYGFFLLLCCMAAICLNACSGGYTSEEGCAYCNRTPTKAYKTSTGEISYVCEKHSTTCFICNGRYGEVKHHFTNGLGQEAFVCEKCYQEYYHKN